MQITVTPEQIKIYFNFNDAKDRSRKDRLRALGFLKYDRANKLWKAKYRPEALLEIVEEFGNDVVYTDSHTEKYFKICKTAEKIRLEKIKTLTEIRKQKCINLGGYRFDVPPFQHQKESLSFLQHTPVVALFADCGIGKTYIMLHWVRYLKENKDIGLKTLVVAPLRTLYSAWGEDIGKFTPELSYTIFNEDTNKARTILAGSDTYDIYLINPDKVRILEKELITFKFDVIIIDESSKMKNPKAKVTKALIRLGDSGPRYRAILSGTPAPNSPLEYWAQLRFLSKRIFGINFYHFREKFFRAGGFGGFTFTLNPYMKEDFNTRLHSYTLRYNARDCLDLPERFDHIIKVLLPPSVMKLYIEYRKKALTTLSLPDKNEETWASFNELDKFLKLREIANGFLLKRFQTIDDQGKVHNTEKIREIHEEKLLALEALLDELGNAQVLIWAHFYPEFNAILKRLPKVEYINGTVSNKLADDRIQRFKQGKLQYLLAHPASLAHGLTFTNCRYIIWYSVDWSCELNYQANKRIERAGQIKTTHHYYLLAHSFDGAETIDSSILYALQGKYKTQLELLNSILETKY